MNLFSRFDLLINVPVSNSHVNAITIIGSQKWNTLIIVILQDHLELQLLQEDLSGSPWSLNSYNILRSRKIDLPLPLSLEVYN